MGEQEGHKIARKILERLYEAWERHTHISLNPVEKEGGWDRGVFRTVVEKLEKQHGLIRSCGSSYTFELTPSGVLYAEENAVVPKDRADWHGKVRRHILSFLADLYDKEGGRAHAHWEKIAECATVQDNMKILQDLSLLSNLGYVKATSVSTFRITEEGLCHYRGMDYEEIV